jgi:hypothetical protein
MGEACGMYWRDEVHTLVWEGNLKERSHLEVLFVNGRIILKRIFRK